MVSVLTFRGFHKSHLEPPASAVHPWPDLDICDTGDLGKPGSHEQSCRPLVLSMNARADGYHTA
jgi:hypothetical protein